MSHWKILVVCAIIGLMIAGILIHQSQGNRPHPPQSWPVDELHRHLSKAPVDHPVRVSLMRHPIPTADPLVWNYHPGEDPAAVPLTYQIHFAEPPKFSPVGELLVIQGAASFVPDGVRRFNGVPGFVRLDGAIVVR